MRDLIYRNFSFLVLCIINEIISVNHLNTDYDAEHVQVTCYGGEDLIAVESS